MLFLNGFFLYAVAGQMTSSMRLGVPNHVIMDVNVVLINGTAAIGAGNESGVVYAENGARILKNAAGVDGSQGECPMPRTSFFL